MNCPKCGAPERAEPLKWIDSFYYSSAKSFGDLRFALERCSTFGDAWYVCGVSGLRFQGRDAAKAHAEELHQKAFREFVEKWGKK